MDKQVGRAGQAVGHFLYGQVILLEAVNEAANEATSEFVAWCQKHVRNVFDDGVNRS